MDLLALALIVLAGFALVATQFGFDSRDLADDLRRS